MRPVRSVGGFLALRNQAHYPAVEPPIRIRPARMVSSDYVLASSPPPTGISVIRVSCELRMLTMRDDIGPGAWAATMLPSLSSCSGKLWRASKDEPHLEDCSVYGQVWWASAATPCCEQVMNKRSASYCLRHLLGAPSNPRRGRPATTS